MSQNQLLPKQIHNPKTIIVLQTAFLGDIALAQPLLENLREQFPKANLVFVSTPQGVELLKNNVLGLSLIAFDKRKVDRGYRGFLRIRKKLKNMQPDLVFCLHRSLRSTMLASSLGGFSVGFKEGACSWIFNRTVSRKSFAFEAQKNNSLLAALLESSSQKLIEVPHFQVDLDPNSWLHQQWETLPKFCVIAPGSVWATKRWLPENFAELAGKIWKEWNLRTVLLASSQAEDVQACTEIVSAFKQSFPQAPEPFQWAGKTNLQELMAVCARAEFVVCNDSAPLHLAIGMGAKVVGIFGPTTKELGFFPLTEIGHSQVSELNGLE